MLAKSQSLLTLKVAITAISQLYQVRNTMVNLLNDIKTLKNKPDESRHFAVELKTQNLRDELKKAILKRNR